MKKIREIILPALIISGCTVNPQVIKEQSQIKNKCIQLTKLIDGDSKEPKLTCVSIDESGKGFINGYEVSINNNSNIARFYLQREKSNFIEAKIENNEGDCIVGEKI